MLSTNDSMRVRMRLTALFLALIGIAIGVWLYFVQIVRHDELLEKARKQYTAVRKVSGKRGEIFDRHGNLLVSNEPCVNITCDPAIIAGLDLPPPDESKLSPEKKAALREKAAAKAELNRRKTAYFISSHLGLDYREMYEKLTPYRKLRDREGRILCDAEGREKTELNRYVVIARNVPLLKGRAMREAARQNKIRSLFFADSYKRCYPKGKMLSNVLGLSKTAADGSEESPLGIEKFYNTLMRSSDGRKVYERGRDGRRLDYGYYEEEQERDGRNIYLTIDEVLQSILEEELDAAYAKYTPKALYAIIADPKTGEILAISQRPNFDPNEKLNSDDLRTRIASDPLEPGSIIKPFTVGRALDDGVVTADTLIDCERGNWFYLNKPLRDSHPYDKLTVAGVIQKSSNIGTAKIALMLGKDAVYDTLKKFGFGERTGLPLRPETRGRLPSPRRWDGLSITRFPIGYGITVSPVQMVRAYCALADDGNLRTLRLVDRIEDPATGEIRRPESPPPRKMFKNPGTCRKLVSMMTLVTEKGGTATQAKIEGYPVAGKTGTSRKFVNGSYASGKYFGSFVGFVPADDPKFVMLVTMDEPKGAYYGGTVSAPVFKRVAELALKYYNIPPRTETETTDAAAGAAKEGSASR